MNRDSGRSHASTCAVIAAALAFVLCPSAGTLAQDSAEPSLGTESAGVPAEPAINPPNSHERRRAARVEASQARQREAEARAAAKAAADGEAGPETEIVCKSIKPTGSNVGRRVCGTPEQWAALEEKTTDAAREDMRRVHTSSGVTATAPGPATPP